MLVYNNIDPREAKNFAIGLIATALVLGIYCIVKVGIAPLLIALVGIAVIYLYSGGTTPISYLPIGELVSGTVMGGLITLASHCCCAGSLDFMVLVWAIPLILGIGLIMMTNNCCDIEKDIEAGRKTLPVLLGREVARKAYHAVVYACPASICIIVVAWFASGWVVLPFMLLAIHPLARALLGNPLVLESRGPAFGQCISLNVAMGAFYCAAVLASAYRLF